MSRSYNWGSPGDFVAESTDIVIGMIGPEDATKLFLRTIGLTAAQDEVNGRTIVPARLSDHPVVGSRLVLAVLPPADDSISGGLEKLEMWLDQTYATQLRTQMRVTGLLWLINAYDSSPPSPSLFSKTTFNALEPFFEPGQMKSSTYPITLLFHPSNGSSMDTTTKTASNHHKSVQDALEKGRSIAVTAWRTEQDGTAMKLLESSISNRKKRVMKQLGGSKDHHRDDVIVAVMGPTGTGKTNFITKARIALCPDSPPVSPGKLVDAVDGPVAEDRLKSGTKDISAYRILNHPDYQGRLVLLDTPGFDDRTQDDGIILTKIANWLDQTYRDIPGVTLTGILYFSRITDNRASGSALRNLKLLGNVCGDRAASNVIFITTMWDHMTTDEKRVKAQERLQQYQDIYWKKLFDLGAHHERFDNNSASLQRILRGIANKESIKQVTLLVDELVRLEKDVRETGAAQGIRDDQERKIKELRKEYESLKDQLPRLKEGSVEKNNVEAEATKKDEAWKLIHDNKVALTPEARKWFSLKAIKQTAKSMKPGAPKAV